MRQHSSSWPGQPLQRFIQRRRLRSVGPSCGLDSDCRKLSGIAVR